MEKCLKERGLEGAETKRRLDFSLRVAGLIMQTCLCAVVGNRRGLWLRGKRLIIGAAPSSGCLVLIGFLLLEDFLIYAEGTGFLFSWCS